MGDAALLWQLLEQGQAERRCKVSDKWVILRHLHQHGAFGQPWLGVWRRCWCLSQSSPSSISVSFGAIQLFRQHRGRGGGGSSPRLEHR
jgi:hypothetical protein